MSHNDSGVDVEVRRGRPALWRWLLVLPLAYGVYYWVSFLPWVFDIGGQDSSYYLANLAIVLIPPVVYVAAAVLLLSRRPHRLAWLVILACGVGMTAWYVAYTLAFYPWRNYMVLPIYVTGLAGSQVVWSLVSVTRNPHDREPAAGGHGRQL